MGIREALHRELSEAMLRRDATVVGVLRSALSELANAEAQPPADMRTSTTGSTHIAGATAGLGAAEVQRVSRSEDQQRVIVAREVAELNAHVTRLTSLCRREDADAARRAAQALARILDEHREAL